MNNTYKRQRNIDSFGRTINYLRISITDRCNLRCRYCFVERSAKSIPRRQILSFRDFVRIVKVAVDMGFDKFRITGGEPLVRPGIVRLVSMLSQIKGVDDLSITTNGVLLDKYARPLFKAGLHRLNISLDTMNPDRYRYLTRCGNLQNVLDGINASKKAGFTGIKINCVIKKSSSEPDAQDVARFASKNGLEVRFIREMNLAKGNFQPIQGGESGHCGKCNRLRLTSNSLLKPCLFSDLEYDLYEMGIRKAFEKAIREKPGSGKFSLKNRFYSIGG